MKHKVPKVSVGMPVYNGESYLREAISAVLNQTLPDFELIISDNASDDGTEKICREFAAKDSRIRYTRNAENLGAARNYNKVFELARGEYFRWFNCDDVIAPDLHEKCVAILDEHPEAVLTYGKTMLIDEEGRPIEPLEDNLNLQQELGSDRFLDFFKGRRLTNAIYGLMRPGAMRNTNLFGDGSMPAVDVIFMAELTLQGTFIEMPEVLFYRRMHPEALSYDRADEERHQYFWQAKLGAFRLPVLRRYLGYFRSVRRAPIGAMEKFRLYLYITKWTIASSPVIVREVFRYIQKTSHARSL